MALRGDVLAYLAERAEKTAQAQKRRDFLQKLAIGVSVAAIIVAIVLAYLFRREPVPTPPPAVAPIGVLMWKEATWLRDWMRKREPRQPAELTGLDRSADWRGKGVCRTFGSTNAARGPFRHVS